MGCFPISLGEMTPQDQLLSEVEAFLEARKLAPTKFGRLAVNDGKLVSRLRAGANMTISTLDRVRAFMREQEAHDHDERAA